MSNIDLVSQQQLNSAHSDKKPFSRRRALDIRDTELPFSSKHKLERHSAGMSNPVCLHLICSTNADYLFIEGARVDTYCVGVDLYFFQVSRCVASERKRIAIFGSQTISSPNVSIRAILQLANNISMARKGNKIFICIVDAFYGYILRGLRRRVAGKYV
jgi:hypothetical protein